jgi:hypothetical protein
MYGSGNYSANAYGLYSLPSHASRTIKANSGMLSAMGNCANCFGYVSFDTVMERYETYFKSTTLRIARVCQLLLI